VGCETTFADRNQYLVVGN